MSTISSPKSNRQDNFYFFFDFLMGISSIFVFQFICFIFFFFKWHFALQNVIPGIDFTNDPLLVIICRFFSYSLFNLVVFICFNIYFFVYSLIFSYF